MAIPPSRESLASKWELEKVKSETLLKIEISLDLALSRVQAATQQRKTLVAKRAQIVAKVDHQIALEKSELTQLKSQVQGLQQRLIGLRMESKLQYLEALTKVRIQKCIQEIQAARGRLDKHSHTLHYEHNSTKVDISTTGAYYKLLGEKRRLGNTNNWQSHQWFEKV